MHTFPRQVIVEYVYWPRNERETLMQYTFVGSWVLYKYPSTEPSD